MVSELSRITQPKATLVCAHVVHVVDVIIWKVAVIFQDKYTFMLLSAFESNKQVFSLNLHCSMQQGEGVFNACGQLHKQCGITARAQVQGTCEGLQNVLPFVVRSNCPRNGREGIAERA